MGQNQPTQKTINKRVSEIRSRYAHWHVSTERRIIFNKLHMLATDPKQYKPLKHKNQLGEQNIGHFRDPTQRKCATADVAVLKDIMLYLKQEPPSFLEAGPREDLYFNPAKMLTVGILTSGGVAPGLNTVIHSIVNMHENFYRFYKTQILGFLGGFAGVESRNFVRLYAENTKSWIARGGSELYCEREKKTVKGEKEKFIKRIVESLSVNKIDILYVIGGDGSLAFAHDIANNIWANRAAGGRKIVVAGIPKTMDNDILWVWHSFGFDTAVEEATGVINSIHADIRAGHRIGVVQLFGRDAGFVAAHAALGSGRVDAVLVPEIDFEIDPLLEYIEGKVAREGYALIVAAEGASPRGTSIHIIKKKLKGEGRNPKAITDPVVNRRLSSWTLEVLVDALEKRFQAFDKGRHQVSVVQPRYLVRAVPPNSIDQIYCRRLADLAVHNALAGYTDFMISQWLTEYILVPLELVAEEKDLTTGKRQVKRIPPEGIFWKTVTNSTGQPAFA